MVLTQMPTIMRRKTLPENIEKIDLHTHIIPETWPDWNKEFGYEGWLTIRHDPDGVIPAQERRHTNLSSPSC